MQTKTGMFKSQNPRVIATGCLDHGRMIVMTHLQLWTIFKCFKNDIDKWLIVYQHVHISCTSYDVQLIQVRFINDTGLADRVFHIDNTRIMQKVIYYFTECHLSHFHTPHSTFVTIYQFIPESVIDQPAAE